MKFPNVKGSGGWTVIIDPKTTGPVTTKPTPEKINIITGSPLTMAVNGTPQRIQAEVQPSDAKQGLSWTSLSPSVAAVDADGAVSPGIQGSAKIIASAKVLTGLADTIDINVIVPLKVDSIRLAPHDLVLYLGGASHLLTTTVVPPSPSSGVVFTSSDKGIVEVGADGRVTAKAKGDALITAQPLGNPGISDTCRIMVVKDDPVLDVGAGRKIATGEEVTFPIKVTQKHGSIAILKWGLDGNGVWDADSANDSVAAPKMKYTGANTANNGSISDAWSVDQLAQTTQLVENLAGKQGGITITREAFDDAGNRRTTTVVVYGDSVGPVVPTFTSVTTAFPTNNTRPTWAWTGSGGGNGTFRYVFNGQAEVLYDLWEPPSINAR